MNHKTDHLAVNGINIPCIYNSGHLWLPAKDLLKVMQLNCIQRLRNVMIYSHTEKICFTPGGKLEIAVADIDALVFVSSSKKTSDEHKVKFVTQVITKQREYAIIEGASEGSKMKSAYDIYKSSFAIRKEDGMEYATAKKGAIKYTFTKTGVDINSILNS